MPNKQELGPTIWKVKQLSLLHTLLGEHIVGAPSQSTEVDKINLGATQHNVNFN
jgi:hypothetical protein